MLVALPAADQPFIARQALGRHDEGNVGLARPDDLDA
jgi:hypothetical protein